MSPILFGVVFGSIMLFLIVDILTKKAPIPVTVSVAKAGKVTDPCSITESLKYGVPQFINVDGKRIDVSKYVVFYVHGESMGKYKIHDKQMAFVEPLASTFEISGHSVLVLRIINPNDAGYKLRKFVCLIDSIENTNWEDVYEKNKDRISIPQNDFIAQCVKKASKDKDCLTGKVILSETYDVTAKKDCYSLHALSTAFGTVEYVV